MKWLLDLILSFTGQKSSKVSEIPQNAEKDLTSAIEKPLKSQQQKTAKKTEPRKMAVLDEPWEDVNWAMPDAKISKYFTVKEALWLNTWKQMALPSATQRKQIWLLAHKMDVVREFLGVPLIVTSWLRPPAYNVAIGGAKRSAHMDGQAIDVVPRGISCEAARQKLLPKLKEWGMRMEDNAHINGGNWVHLDIRPVKWKRFFKP